MTIRFTKEQLNLRLADIDAKFSTEGVPQKYRPLYALNTLYGSVADGGLRNSLLEPIALWFIEKYGEAARWDGMIGRGPHVIRESVYLIAFPFTSGDAALRVTDYVENLPQDVKDSLTEEELHGALYRAAEAALHFGTLYDLTVQDVTFDDMEKALVRRGIADLEVATYSLKNTGDTQNTIFHTHQAAEKFLKIGLKRSGFKGDLKSLQHDLPKIFEHLVALNSRYSWLKGSVTALQNFAPDMEIRYATLPRSLENAISSFYSSLNICAVLARIWLFDIARGTEKAAFVAGRFYKDEMGNTCRCEGLTVTANRPAAVLRLFGNHPMGALMMDVGRDLDQSCLYLEIMDKHEVEKMERLYQLHLKMRGEEKKPEELGIKITSGPEGSYMTRLIHTKTLLNKG